MALKRRLHDRSSEYEDDIAQISYEEARKHSTPEDAWIVIKGAVYDVTEYLAFHPGGRDNMMRGVCVDDATQLFNETHPWVNYDRILSKNYVGRVNIQSTVDADIAMVRFLPTEIDSKSTSSYRLDLEVPQYVVREIERFVDYKCVQMDDLVLVIFKTGKYGNPFFEIRKPSDNRWTFVITFIELVFVYKFSPMEPLLRPPRFKVSYDSGIVEVGFEKANKMPWKSCGTMENHTRKFIKPLYSKKYIIKEHVVLNKYTFMVSLQKKDQSICNAPLGSYIFLYNDVNERREYSPVPYFFLNGFRRDIKETYNNSLFTLLVRRYSDGRLSNFLYSKKVGDTILGSEPSGFFDLHIIKEKQLFMFMAGGVGVSPFLGLIQFLLERTILPTRRIVLVMFNPTHQHQFLQDKFHILSTDPRFFYHYVLTKPPPDYQGLQGHLTIKMLRHLIHRQFDNDEVADIFFIICGPQMFLNGCNEQFVMLDINSSNTFFFNAMSEEVKQSTGSHTMSFQQMEEIVSRDTIEFDSKVWRRTSSLHRSRVSLSPSGIITNSTPHVANLTNRLVLIRVVDEKKQDFVAHCNITNFHVQTLYFFSFNIAP